MSIFKNTKAGRLLKVAHATYKRGEEEIARDLFVLAMDEDDAGELMEAPVAPPSEDELKAQLMQAMESGDFTAAQDAIQKLQEMKAQDNPDAEKPPEDPAAPPADAPPAEEPKPEELPAPVVSALMALARRIDKAGHKDLSGRIVAALMK